jgi:hypothetical protein
VRLNETIELSEGDESHHKEIGFNKLISLILGEHSGPIYVLFRSSEQELTREAVAANGFKLQATAMRGSNATH